MKTYCRKKYLENNHIVNHIIDYHEDVTCDDVRFCDTGRYRGFVTRSSLVSRGREMVSRSQCPRLRLQSYRQNTDNSPFPSLSPLLSIQHNTQFYCKQICRSNYPCVKIIYVFCGCCCFKKASNQINCHCQFIMHSYKKARKLFFV